MEGFEALGAEVAINEDHYLIKAKKLKGCMYFFSNVSVTATESMILAATLAEGTTTLKNCAMEPEIVALTDYLNKVGAKIIGAGSPTIIIEGVKSLNATNFEIIPDRIETGTFAIMAALTQSNFTITNCNPNHIESLLNIFSKQGIPYKKTNSTLNIIPSNNDIKAYNIKTHEYPGFPTDLQPPYTVLATQTHGNTLIHETIYDRRLLYTEMLVQMG
ncbi:MAG: UDP-N-acetylglucosamine 1-carboxyvinyltransferase, partial [Candidatus Falkowbacteria bacterium]|nr:UDP-N-acetylglucosamine 1-carboxyvinyltransferase [Candidatus Falkowbacteria bacterium]